MFQSMGITNPRYNALRRRFAQGFAAVILVGNVSFPIAVQLHVVELKCPAHEADRPRLPGTARARTSDADDDARLARSPAGPIEQKWDNHKFDIKLVNPANKRRFEIVVVGTGLAGASAAATLGELGYQVKVITFHDSPRRAHSIAAQGGINAAKNYPNDGDSVYRLFYDTMKGGDYRAREANVYRLAQVSVDIIDQCVAQGVPFAREYGGLLDNRSFGGAQVSRTFYARGQTGQQLLLGAYQALMRQVARRQRDALPARRDARPRREGRPHRRHRVPRPRAPVRCSRSPGTRSCSRPADTATSSTSRRTRRTPTSPPRGAPRSGCVLRQPLLHADPPHVHSGQRRLPIEAHAHVGVVAQRRPGLGAASRSTTTARPTRSPRTSATTCSSGATRRSATSSRATSPRARSSARSTPGGGSGR